MTDIEKMNKRIGENLLNFITRELIIYMKDDNYRYCMSKDDVVVLVPNYINTFTLCFKTFTRDKDIDYMELMGHKVYFLSPHKNSIVILDKRYVKEAKVIRLPGSGDEDD